MRSPRGISYASLLVNDLVTRDRVGKDALHDNFVRDLIELGDVEVGRVGLREWGKSTANIRHFPINWTPNNIK